MLDNVPEMHATKRDRITIRANYELIIDNLLDLSHTSYLHDGILGNSDTVKSEITVEQDGNDVIVGRHAGNATAPGLFAILMPSAPPRVDKFTRMRWMAPSNLRLLTGICMPGAVPESGTGYHAIHMLTPESDRTTHYFFTAVRFNVLTADDELNAQINDKISTTRRFAFEEQDAPVIEAQQRPSMPRRRRLIRSSWQSSRAGPIQADPAKADPRRAVVGGLLMLRRIAARRVGRAKARMPCRRPYARSSKARRAHAVLALTRGHGAAQSSLRRLRKLVCVRAPLPTLLWGPVKWSGAVPHTTLTGPSANSTGKAVVGHQPQTPSSLFLGSFFVRLSRFSVPTTIQREHRVAAAVKAGRRCASAPSSTFARPRLDGGEHGARLDGRDGWSRDERRDVILDWAVNVQCGSNRITFYPVGCENPVP